MNSNTPATITDIRRSPSSITPLASGGGTSMPLLPLPNNTPFCLASAGAPATAAAETPKTILGSLAAIGIYPGGATSTAAAASTTTIDSSVTTADSLLPPPSLPPSSSTNGSAPRVLTQRADAVNTLVYGVALEPVGSIRQVSEATICQELRPLGTSVYEYNGISFGLCVTVYGVKNNRMLGGELGKLLLALDCVISTCYLATTDTEFDESVLRSPKQYEFSKYIMAIGGRALASRMFASRDTFLEAMYHNARLLEMSGMPPPYEEWTDENVTPTAVKLLGGLRRLISLSDQPTTRYVVPLATGDVEIFMPPTLNTTQMLVASQGTFPPEILGLMTPDQEKSIGLFDMTKSLKFPAHLWRTVTAGFGRPASKSASEYMYTESAAADGSSDGPKRHSLRNKSDAESLDIKYARFFTPQNRLQAGPLSANVAHLVERVEIGVPTVDDDGTQTFRAVRVKVITTNRANLLKSTKPTSAPEIKFDDGSTLPARKRAAKKADEDEDENESDDAIYFDAIVDPDDDVDDKKPQPPKKKAKSGNGARPSRNKSGGGGKSRNTSSAAASTNAVSMQHQQRTSTRVVKPVERFTIADSELDALHRALQQESPGVAAQMARHVSAAPEHTGAQGEARAEADVIATLHAQNSSLSAVFREITDKATFAHARGDDSDGSETITTVLAQGDYSAHVVAIDIRPELRAKLRTMEAQRGSAAAQQFYASQPDLRKHVRGNFVDRQSAILRLPKAVFSEATAAHTRAVLFGPDGPEKDAVRRHVDVGAQQAFDRVVKTQSTPARLEFDDSLSGDFIDSKLAPHVGLCSQMLGGKKQWGAQALKDFAEGEFIGFYKAEFVAGGHAQLDAREAVYRLAGRLPSEDDDYTIEGLTCNGVAGFASAADESCFGSVLRYANDSPNGANAHNETEYVEYVDGVWVGGVAFVASRAIKCGESILFNYGAEFRKKSADLGIHMSEDVGAPEPRPARPTERVSLLPPTLAPAAVAVLPPPPTTPSSSTYASVDPFHSMFSSPLQQQQQHQQPKELFDSDLSFTALLNAAADEAHFGGKDDVLIGGGFDGVAFDLEMYQ